MVSLRSILAVCAALMVCACRTSAPTETVCPDRIITWMACPGSAARSGVVCQVYGPELGCGLDRIAIDFANDRHSRRSDIEPRARFYTFAIAVTASGASRVTGDEAPLRPSYLPFDF